MPLRPGSARNVLDAGIALSARRQDGPYVILLPDGWESPEILLQQVPEPKAGKNRMHLDIRSPDIYAE